MPRVLCSWQSWCLIPVAGLVLAACGYASPGKAQSSDSAKVVSQPVVQALPPKEAQQLSEALATLNRNPRDVEALIDAGEAALAMNDTDAAIGFFKRADQVASNNARVKAGLAGALVRKGDALAAFPLFEEAKRLGARPKDFAAAQALAYDLIGNNGAAQELYKIALANGAGAEVTRLLAISEAIEGDERAAEAALMPLLRKQDKAAWRARVFSLAILGETNEAIKIAKTLLPADLAEGVTPYLSYMPRLTPSQQAAAANLGVFPRASEIGRDDPRVAAFAHSGRRSVASIDTGLVPRGAPLGQNDGRHSEQALARKTASEDENRVSTDTRKPRRTAVRAADRTPPPEPRPARQTSSAEISAVAAASGVAVKEPRPTVELPARTAAATTVPSPGFDLADMAQSRASGNETRSVSPPDSVATEDRPVRRVNLSEVFEDLGVPSVETTPIAGAVDIRKIVPAEPSQEPKPKAERPSLPTHPTRIWVQLGIGQDKKALAFDWRKLTRGASDAFNDKKPYVSELGQTNRMLTGPFESAAAANRFIAELRSNNIDGPYVWTSAAGQVVDALPLR